MVLLQMQQDNYLNKSCYSPATSKFPRPADLPTHLKRGDFDLLFIHRDRGLIVAEIKAIGWRPGSIFLCLVSFLAVLLSHARKCTAYRGASCERISLYTVHYAATGEKIPLYTKPP